MNIVVPNSFPVLARRTCPNCSLLFNVTLTVSLGLITTFLISPLLK
ncbi:MULTISPECIES: hypothetical protein [unclassified Clostridioides]|nr:hypothetical protein [Clostridioides sp. ZZV14-6387]